MFYHMTPSAGHVILSDICGKDCDTDKNVTSIGERASLFSAGPREKVGMHPKNRKLKVLMILKSIAG